MEYTNVLAISARGKGIPYGGSGVRNDGGRNYGFRALKDHAGLIDEIPEAQQDPSLRNLLHAVNGSQTGLFSVGCSSGPTETEGDFIYSGYFEFAINDIVAVADAANLFPVFYHFDRLLKREAATLGVQFLWEIEHAAFADAGVEGFTCSVTMRTAAFPSREDAKSAWENALALLANLLAAVPARVEATPIY